MQRLVPVGRMTDALLTLLAPGWDSRLRRLEAQAREVTVELASTLEKLNTWAAREAKRQSRAARERVEEIAGDHAPAQQLPLPVTVPVKRSKSELRALLAQGILKPARPTNTRGEDEHSATAVSG